MNKEELKQRTEQLGLRIIGLMQSLPKNSVVRVTGNQLLRSGTAIGAAYRAACRARSNAEEEADESADWMKMLSEAKLIEARLLVPRLKEAHELRAIVFAARKTARRNK